MKLSLPLSMLRIWSRNTGSWLSWVTKGGERYFAESGGYFLELPDGSLAQLRARVAFPVIDRFPALMLSDVSEQPLYGPGARFIAVPKSGPRSGKPRAISLDAICEDIDDMLPPGDGFSDIEYYVLLRLYESGVAKLPDLMRAQRRRRPGESFGQSLIRNEICSWEFMLAVCMDCPSASRLDPPADRALAQRRDWELTGEILVAMGKLNRSDLERALRMKHDGSRALGEILSSMGACTVEDVEQCLKLQDQTRKKIGAEVALIGQLLVNRGVISRDDFEEALRHQRVGRQSLERILVSMGACTQLHIDDFVRQNNWHQFQAEIDDIRLGRWLVQTGVIKQHQLDEALRIQTRGRQVLGELLVSMRLCTADEINEALASQKSLREEHASGLEKLGALMIRQEKVDQDQLDRALKLQSIGRRPIGCILAATKACSAQDVGQALEIQREWRQSLRPQGDRLGELLLYRQLIDLDVLTRALSELPQSGKPLGRLLVDDSICRPEDIIDALLERDRQHHAAFSEYLHRCLPPPAAPSEQAAAPQARGNAESFMTRLSGLIRKPAAPDPR